MRKIFLAFILTCGMLFSSCGDHYYTHYADKIDAQINNTVFVMQVSASPLVSLYNEINAFTFNNDTSKISLLSRLNQVNIICNTGEIIKDEFTNETIKQKVGVDTIPLLKYVQFVNRGDKDKYNPKIINRISTSKASKIFKLHPDWSKENCVLISQHQVQIGMIREMCIMAWGRPTDINRSTGSWGVHEQWVYNSKSFLYLENGILTSLQN